MDDEELEASRLVFVSVKDAKPKRKVAVPIPQGLQWEDFLVTVQTKLKLSNGIEEIVLASSGEKVNGLEQLQDIDELYVTQAVGALPSASQGNGNTLLGSNQQRTATADSEISPLLNSQLANDADAEAKYVKRQTSVQRALKRVFPSLFTQSSLPVTTKDTATLTPVEQVRRRMRRRRSSVADPRMVFIIFSIVCMMGMLGFAYIKATQSILLPTR